MPGLLNESFAIGLRPVRDLAAAIKVRQVRVSEVISYYLDRIDRLDGKYGAFSYIDQDRCREEAAALDRELAKGIYRGPLVGIPVGVKDVYSVTGMPMSLGSSAALELQEPSTENEVILELRRSGAIILGKTSMTELSLGTVNLTRSTPWNPVDPDVHRTPGGSSSGSAVAVAAGLCPLALGTDTGGSVRQPAAMCGVVGYKSTYGRWPQSGVFPLSRSLDSLGFFTRSTSDIQFVLAGLGDYSETVSEPPIENVSLGVPIQFCRDLAPSIQRGFNELLEDLATKGAQAEFIDCPEVDEVAPYFRSLVPRELLIDLGGQDIYEKNKPHFDPMTIRRVEDALNTSLGSEKALRGELHRLQQNTAMKMQGFNAWICPTAPHFPTRMEHLDSIGKGVAWNASIARNVRPINVFGQCAISLPMRLPDEKFPMGIQLIAAHGKDNELLALARSLERLMTY